MTTKAAEKAAAVVVPKNDDGATPEELEKDLKTSTVKGPRGEDITFTHRVSIIFDYEFVTALDIVRAGSENSSLRGVYDAAMSIVLPAITEWDYKGDGKEVLPLNEDTLKKMGVFVLIDLVTDIANALKVGE